MVKENECHMSALRPMNGLFVFALIMSCSGGPSNTVEESEPIAEQASPVLVNMNSLWLSAPNIAQNPVRIPVCFENRSDQADNGNWVTSVVDSTTATFRGWVRDAVESTWQRFARINFTGWGACSSSTIEPGIHIFLDTPTRCNCTGGGSRACIPGLCATCSTTGVGCIGGYYGAEGSISGNTSDGAGEVGPQGYQEFFVNGAWARATTGKGAERGMRLNPWMPNLFGGTPNKQTTYAVAVHEFGHALGFYHSYQRSDETSCDPDAGNTVTATKVGGVNSPSIMGSCGGGPVWGLSPEDVMAVQRVYGHRIPGQIVSRRGYCLAATAGAAQPFTWTCDEFQDDQEWVRATFGKFFIDRGATKQCLRVDNVPSPDQAAIKLATCAAGFSGNEAVGTDLIEIRGVGGKCLTRHGLNNAVTLEPCASENTSSWTEPTNTDPNQKFLVTAYLIASPDSTSCLHLSSSALGTAPIMASCTGAAMQRFSFTNLSQIKNLGANKCLGVNGPNDATYMTGVGGPGSQVTLAACTQLADLRQRWHFSGQMKIGSKCIDRPSGVDGNSVFPWTWGCHSSFDAPGGGDTGPATGPHTGQQWDYYFKGCNHDLCVAGPGLDRLCDDCVNTVCATDPFCCDVQWDSICAGEVASLCGGSCN